MCVQQLQMLPMMNYNVSSQISNVTITGLQYHILCNLVIGFSISDSHGNDCYGDGIALRVGIATIIEDSLVMETVTTVKPIAIFP